MISDVRSFVLYWNSLFPIDLWWRFKHKTPFNSSSHREMSMIDMMFEFIEDEYINKKPKENPYDPTLGNWLNVREKSQEEIEQEFDSIDLDDIEL